MPAENAPHGSPPGGDQGLAWPGGEDDVYPPVHPDADKLTVPKWDEPGQCICGAVLPPMKEWDRAGSDWQNVRCSACPRGYVDEEEFIAIYDDTSDWDDE